MALAEIVQEIADARVDARSLSEFVWKPASFMVTRRLAPAIHTLEYYLGFFEASAVRLDAKVASFDAILVQKTADAQAIANANAVAVTARAETIVKNTLDDIINSSGFAIVDSFELGATITQRNQALRHTATANLYRWAGDLPKVVAASSTPTSSGGFGNNAWLEVSDVALKTQLTPLLRPLVVVASGQSNMDGAGDGGTMPSENPNVKFFDLTTRNFRTLSYTNRILRKNVNDGGGMTIPATAGKNNMAFSFCHEAHKATGRPVYLIIVSNGGTHIGRWVGSEAGSVSTATGGWGGIGVAKPLYVELKIAVDEALDLIGVSKVDAFLWHQGETKRPSAPKPSDYKADLATLTAMLKAEPWWSDSTQFIAGEQIIGSYYQNAENYNDIWQDMNVDGNPYTKAVSQEGLVMNSPVANPDSVHFNGQSLYEMGKRMWRAYLGDSVALAKQYSPDITEYGAKSTTYDWKTPFGQAITIDPIGKRIVEKKGKATIRAGGGYASGQRVVNNISAHVVHNDDGTFTVTPTGLVLQNWSFILEDFWLKGRGITRTPASFNEIKIEGKVDMTKVEKFRLWVDGSTSISIKFEYTPYLNGKNANADDLLQIDWGDGVVESNLSKGLNSHTYADAYKGWVVFSLPALCEIFIVVAETGRWKSSLSELSKLSGLTYLEFKAGSAMYGDIKTLPKSLVTLRIGGDCTCVWDFTGLPNLKTLFAQGFTKVNAPNETTDLKLPSVMVLAGAARTPEQLDKILIALAKVPQWDGTKTINANYSGQPTRTVASDAAVAELTSKGVTVTTN